MITPKQIEEQLFNLAREEAELRTMQKKILEDHQRRTEMVQQTATANQNRLQQIAGATMALKQLLNGANGAEQPKEQT